MLFFCLILFDAFLQFKYAQFNGVFSLSIFGERNSIPVI
jgi:hypothetical protein